MHFRKKKTTEFDYDVFKTINQIPDSVFDTEKWINNKYLSKQFLHAIEHENKNLEFLYVIIRKQQQILLFSAIQISTIQFKDTIDNKCILMREVTSLVSKYSRRHPFYLIVCGNIFISGEHGIVYKNNENNQKLLEALFIAIENNNKTITKKRIHAILVKDFYSEINTLKSIGFSTFKTEPTLIFEINPEWQTFNDYLMAMKAKYRTKAKKTYKESAVLTDKDLSASEIKQYLPQLTTLYNKVEEKSTFTLGKLDLNTYSELKNKFLNDFVLRTYWLEDKIIGFMAAMVNNNVLDAHYVGIDYEYNRKYYVYQRMLYDYVQIAIDKKLAKVNFGRTATEIKSTVGAVPVDLLCYVKHSCKISNSILKPLTESVRLPEFKLIKPFK